MTKLEEQLAYFAAVLSSMVEVKERRNETEATKTSIVETFDVFTVHATAGVDETGEDVGGFKVVNGEGDILDAGGYYADEIASVKELVERLNKTGTNAGDEFEICSQSGRTSDGHDLTIGYEFGVNVAGDKTVTVTRTVTDDDGNKKVTVSIITMNNDGSIGIIVKTEDGSVSVGTEDPVTYPTVDAEAPSGDDAAAA